MTPSEAKSYLNWPILSCILHSSDGIGAQERVIWLRRPQGAPSGVCTGQMYPQASGKSFLTVVVFISVKYCPLWMLLKCDRYLVKFNLSATIVNPAVYYRSSWDLVTKFPVAKKFSNFFPMLVYESISLFK